MSTMPMSGGYADYDLENQQLERRRKMAEMLAQQSGQGVSPGQMVGNQYVPTSWTQHLAQALKGPLAERELSRLDTQQKQLGERKQNDMRTEMQRFSEALQGREAQTFQPATSNDDEGNPIPSATSEAIPPNIKLAQQLAMGAKNPMLQQWGMSQMMPKTPKWEKAELPNADGSKRVGYVDINSPNPLSTFQAGGTAPVKREFVNSQGVNPYTGETQGAPIPQQLAPDSIVRRDANGNLVENVPVTSIRGRLAEKGATRVDVKTDVKTGESLAGQVGGIMKDSSITADGAVKQIDAAQRIVNAVDSGKIIAGPGATPQVFLKQLGQKIGAGGKDDPEILANTRSAIRGLAELTLQGRQQMRGQGAITESEGELAKRAMSGDIDSLTPAEIKQLAKASERAARFNHAQHERRMNAIRNNPDLQKLAPFYEAPPVPAEVAPGSAVKRYNPATGTFE